MKVNKDFISKIGNEKIKKQIEEELKKIKVTTPKKEKKEKKVNSFNKTIYKDLQSYNVETKDYLLLVLPMPEPELSPNRILHWSKKLSYKQAAKKLGKDMITELRSKGSERFNEEGAEIFCTLSIFSNRGQDDDNIEASLKSMRDGIYEGLGLNDSLQKRTLRKINKDKSNIIIFELEKLSNVGELEEIRGYIEERLSVRDKKREKKD